jgi:hypothetical protein
VQVALDAAAATIRALEAASSARLCCSDAAMVLNERCSAPISPTPLSGMRPRRSPPASRPAIAAAASTGRTIAR